MSNSGSKISKLPNSKQAKEQEYYGLCIVPLSENYDQLLIIQSGRQQHTVSKATKRQSSSLHFNPNIEEEEGCSWINLGIVANHLYIGEDADNALHPIAEIRNENLAGGDLSIVALVDGKDKINEWHSLYYVEMNGLYKLDLSSIYKFIATGELKHLQG